MVGWREECAYSRGRGAGVWCVDEVEGVWGGGGREVGAEGGCGGWLGGRGGWSGEEWEGYVPVWERKMAPLVPMP